MLPGVSQTAVLTLRARADEHARADRLFADPLAAEWFDRVGWLEALDGWYADGAQTNVALRVDDLDRLLTRVVADEGARSVVELGAGLSTRAARLDLDVAWVAVDLPEIAALRGAWGAAGVTVSGSVLDPATLAAVEADRPVIVLEGLLYYLPRASVAALFRSLAARWPGAVVLFDLVGPDQFETLLRWTAALGAPVQWSYDRPFAEVFDAFGLAPVPGFDLDAILADASRRNLARLPPAVKIITWWALEAGAFPARRSGNVVARLPGRDGASPAAP